MPLLFGGFSPSQGFAIFTAYPLGTFSYGLTPPVRVTFKNKDLIACCLLTRGSSPGHSYCQEYGLLIRRHVVC